MPYITLAQRKDLITGTRTPTNVGELNFAITRLLSLYMAENGRCYENYNAVIGVLECAKLELYRRRVADYEDDKIKENGDVY